MGEIRESTKWMQDLQDLLVLFLGCLKSGLHCILIEIFGVRRLVGQSLPFDLSLLVFNLLLFLDLLKGLSDDLVLKCLLHLGLLDEGLGGGVLSFLILNPLLFDLLGGLKRLLDGGLSEDLLLLFLFLFFSLFIFLLLFEGDLEGLLDSLLMDLSLLSLLLFFLLEHLLGDLELLLLSLLFLLLEGFFSFLKLLLLFGSLGGFWSLNYHGHIESLVLLDVRF